MLNHNSYFEGKVQSVGFERLGRKNSIGVVLAGEFRFDTGAAERMNVVSGEFIVRREGEEEWTTYSAGTYFEIKEKSFFDVRTSGPTAYLCEYF